MACTLWLLYVLGAGVVLSGWVLGVVLLHAWRADGLRNERADAAYSAQRDLLHLRSIKNRAN